MKKILIILIFIVLGGSAVAQTEFRTKEELVLLLLDSAKKEFSNIGSFYPYKKDCIIFDSDLKFFLDDKIVNSSVKIKFGDFKKVKIGTYFLQVKIFDLDQDNGIASIFIIYCKLKRNSYALSYNVKFPITYSKEKRKFILSRLQVNYGP